MFRANVHASFYELDLGLQEVQIYDGIGFDLLQRGMKLLCTGDWQIDQSNLHIAKRMVKEVFEICGDYKIKHVINLGDMKNRYSPIDGKVLNFSVNTCSNFKKRDITYDVLLGNHDRYSLITDTNSWLPVLKKAGARIHDTPGVETCPDQTQLFFLPYRSSITETRSIAKSLASRVRDKARSLLFFHQDLKGCGYNVLLRSEAKLKPRDLFPDNYLYCIGGHIHYQHKVQGNTWYCGSPFPMDWGEANQVKGYLLVDTDTGKLKRIESGIPRFYDPLLPNFEASKPKDWKGATIRVRVPVWKSEDYQQKIDHIKGKTEELCPGAHVLVIPKFDNSQPKEQIIDLDASDQEKVKRYVEQICPKELAKDKERLVTYLVYRLKQDHVLTRQKQKITFGKAIGKNVLSYKNVEVDFSKPGITLVTASNKDWPRRSNGGGKTNLLQLLSIAFFGCTFKGQKHDRWVRRKSSGDAFVTQHFDLQDGRNGVITRRRPHKLEFTIEGGDEARDNKKKATQDEIEQTLGFTWETLGASVYVDQRTSNLLLHGTDTERKKILEQIQNLEKYNLALKRVKDDYNRSVDYETDLQARLQTLKDEHAILLSHIDKAGDLGGDKKALQKDFRVKRHALQLLRENGNLDKSITTLRQGFAVLNSKVTGLYKDYNLKIGEVHEAVVRYKRLMGLAKICPTCEQKIDHAYIKRIKARIIKVKKKLSAQAVSLKEKHDEALTERNAVESKASDLADKQRDNEHTEARLMHSLADIEQALARYKEHEDFVKGLLRRKKRVREEIDNLKRNLDHVRYEKVFFNYCLTVFSRNGLPAFLNSYLCPQLNAAAEHHSELWSEGHIKVRFDVEEGVFVPRIINPSGGENIGDQSGGEDKIASIITIFAARDVLTPCNLAILDEPGDGLDATNASWFARKLREVAPKVGSVFVTTHNPNIISELEGCRRIHVVKKNGVSYIHG